MSEFTQVPLRSRFHPDTKEILFHRGEHEPTVVSVIPSRDQESDFYEYTPEARYNVESIADMTPGQLARYTQDRHHRAMRHDHNRFHCPNPHIIWGGADQCTYEPFRLLYQHDDAPFLFSMPSPNQRPRGTWCHGTNMLPRSHAEAWLTYWNARHNDHLPANIPDARYLDPDVLDWLWEQHAPEDLKAQHETPDRAAELNRLFDEVEEGGHRYDKIVREYGQIYATECRRIAFADRMGRPIPATRSAILAFMQGLPQPGNDPLFPDLPAPNDMQRRMQCYLNAHDELWEDEDEDELGEELNEREVAFMNAWVPPITTRTGGWRPKAQAAYDAYAKLKRNLDLRGYGYRQTDEGKRRTERINALYFRYKADVHAPPRGLNYSLADWYHDLMSLAQAAQYAVAEHESRRWQWNTILAAFGLPNQGRMDPNYGRFHRLPGHVQATLGRFQRAQQFGHDKIQPPKIWCDILTHMGLPPVLSVKDFPKDFDLAAVDWVEAAARYFEVTRPASNFLPLMLHMGIDLRPYVRYELESRLHTNKLQACSMLVRTYTAVNENLGTPKTRWFNGLPTLEKFDLVGRDHTMRTNDVKLGFDLENMEVWENPPPNAAMLGLYTQVPYGWRRTPEEWDRVRQDTQMAHLASGYLRGLIECGVDPELLAWEFNPTNRNGTRTEHKAKHIGTVLPCIADTGTSYITEVGGKLYRGVVTFHGQANYARAREEQWQEKEKTVIGWGHGYDENATRCETVIVWGEYTHEE